MAIDSYDIVSTLQALGMMKYWKGKHIILKKQVRKGMWRSICFLARYIAPGLVAEIVGMLRFIVRSFQYNKYG